MVGVKGRSGCYPRPSLEQRFWQKVDRSGGPDACWPWQAAILNTGYGGIKYQGRMTKAHRVAYELTYGPLGDNLALHHCDNPPCCNPAHLFPGTHADNAADRNQKGRQSRGDRVVYGRRRRGSQHPDAILDEARVAAIRAARLEGMGYSALAYRFRVSKSVIARIATNRTWKHVPWPEKDA